MKKSNQSKRGVQDSGQPAVQQPEKVGWIRKFCGRGIFRELWRNRYVMLRGDHLFISDKEVKDERKAQEVFDLIDYERSEELRKAKSRSKKNHSRFTLLRCRQPGNTVPNLVFLAVSPEEKESWVNALNAAIIKAKNRVLDEVTVEEDGVLVHPTRDRVRIPHGRRLPTRGHLIAVASTSSRGVLTLDLVSEEDGFCPDYEGDWEDGFRVGSRGVGGRQRSGTDVSKLRATSKEPKVKTGSLPRGSERSWGKPGHMEASKGIQTQQVQVLQTQSQTPQPGKRFSMQGRSRCASMDEVLSSRPAMIRSELRSALRRCPTEEEAGSGSGSGSVGGGASVQPVGQLQSLIAQRMQRAQELLEEMRLQELQKAKAERERGGSSPYRSIDSPRLHHLRGSDSPQSSRSSGSPRSRSSDSPRFRSKESPRLRGRESPRCKAKKNRSKGSDSPRSRGSGSPHMKDSPGPTDSPRSRTGSPKHREPGSGPGSGSGSIREEDPSAASPRSLRGSETSTLKSSDSPRGSETGTRTSRDSPGPSRSGSFESSDRALSGSGSPPVSSEVLLERRRAEAEVLLEAAMLSWKEAQEVLQEVKQLQSQTLRRQRRRTYEKTAASPGATATGLTPAAGDGDDVQTSPTSPEDDESESP